MTELTDHRVLRARERYGLELTVVEIGALARQASKANLGRALDPLTGVHVLKHGDVPVVAVVVYSAPPAIKTFLPPDYFTAGRFSAWRSLSKERKRAVKRRQREERAG